MKTTKKLNIWTIVHSSACLLFGFIMLYTGRTPVPPFLTAIVPCYGIVIFALLFTIYRRGVLRLPNFISLVRLFFGAAALVMIRFHPPAFIILTLLAVAALSDTFDGLAARALGATDFGAKLDMELDAFFMFLLSAVLYYIGMEGWVLTPGLIRYGYVFVLLALPPAAPLKGAVLRYQKLVCLFSYLLLVAAVAPWITMRVRVFLVLVDILLLGSSFLLDLVFRLVSLKGPVGEKRL